MKKFGYGVPRRSPRFSRRRLGLAALGTVVTACARRVPSVTPSSTPEAAPPATTPPEATVAQPTPAASSTEIPTIVSATTPTPPATVTPSAPRPAIVLTSTVAAPTTTTSTAGTQNNSPYGVSFGATELDERSIPALDWAGRAGIGWLRVVFFWNEIERTRGNRNWRGYDALLAKARSVGMAVSGQVSFVSDWNTSAPVTVFRPAEREHYPPADYNQWQQYVEALVGRYKDQVQAWEVWNEPDLKGFWGGSPAEFAKLLAVTYTAIKRVNPNATVAMGGLSLGGSPGNLDKSFFAEILRDPKYPALKYFDVANFHAYGGAQEIGQRLSYVRAQLAQAGGGNIPIWITEIGYPSDPSQQKTSGFQDGPTSQAKWLIEAFSRLRQAGIARLFWYQLYDQYPVPQALADPFGTDGLLDSSLNPKPALQAYHQVIASGR